MTIMNLPGASFTSVPAADASLVNNSNIQVYTKKYRTQPPNWNELPMYREKFSDNDNQATRTFIGPWGDRLWFKSWVLGYSNNSNGTLSREPPLQHPEMPYLYAVECDLLEPQGAWINRPDLPINPDTNLPIPMIGFYDAATGSDALTARYAVTFRALPFEVLDDNSLANIPPPQTQTTPQSRELLRYVERSSELAIVSLPIPSVILSFSDGTPIGQSGLNRVLFCEEVLLHWYEVPDIPMEAIRACVGRVNRDFFDIPVGGQLLGGLTQAGYEPGTLLCQAPKRRRYRSRTGRVYWDIVYRFLYRRNVNLQGTIVGWNYFPRVIAGTPAQIDYQLATYRDPNNNDTGVAEYEVADMNGLFNMPQPRIYQPPAI